VSLLDKVTQAHRIIVPYVLHSSAAILRRCIRIPRRVVQARRHLVKIIGTLICHTCCTNLTNQTAEKKDKEEQEEGDEMGLGFHFAHPLGFLLSLV
jgi:hypothetical protein